MNVEYKNEDNENGSQMIHSYIQKTKHSVQFSSNLLTYTSEKIKQFLNYIKLQEKLNYGTFDAVEMI